MTKNTPKKTNNKNYTLYDKIISQTLSILINYFKEDENIALLHFNIKDKNHLCILELALILNKISGKKIKISCNKIDYLKLLLKKKYYFKRRKEIKTFKLNSYDEKIIDIYKLIFKILSNYDNNYVNSNIFKDIYNTYYN